MQVSPKISSGVGWKSATIRLFPLSLRSLIFLLVALVVKQLLRVRQAQKISERLVHWWLCCKLMQDRIDSLSLSLSPFHNCAVQNRVNVIFWVKALRFFFSLHLFWHRAVGKEREREEAQKNCMKIHVNHHVTICLSWETKIFFLKAPNGSWCWEELLRRWKTLFSRR